MKIIRIDKGRIIPVTFSLVGTAFLAWAYYSAFLYAQSKAVILIWIALSPLVPLLWTTRKILEINLDKKIYIVYTWMLGYKLGKGKSYDSIENMYLKQVDDLQRSTSQEKNVTSFGSSDFAAFIKFRNGDTLELIKSKDREKIWKDLLVLNKKINTSLIDNIKN